MTPDDILTFWFEELTPKQHFVSDEKLDAEMIRRFSDIHSKAVAGELVHWRNTAAGRLAEIIVIDQFSRNMFRGDARSWTTDPLALELARAAVAAGDDLKIPESQRAFVYMPYMHSESAKAHEEAVVLFEKFGNEMNLKFELRHKEIIDRFGRYPYQNELLGRTSTQEEIEWLRENKGF